MFRLKSCFVGVVTALALWAPTSASAAPIFFGDHAYEIFLSESISWDDANSAAQSLTFNDQSGHLATVTSFDEDNFIDGLRLEAGGGEFWIGGFQTICQPEPLCGWTWVNGEGMVNEGYTNWMPDEPNNGNGGIEIHLAAGLHNMFGWNDEGYLPYIMGYVVEWDFPPIARQEVPEPSSLALLLVALAGLGFANRRRIAA